MTLRSIALILIVICTATMAVFAQPVSGVGSVASGDPGLRGGATHGWFVSARRDTQDWDIFHVPPRDAGTVPGMTRFANRSVRKPLFIAAKQARLFMVYEDPSPNNAAFPTAKIPDRRVLSLEAVSSGRGMWATMPLGRLDAYPSIGGEGRLLGFSASDDSVYALREGVPGRASRATLEVMTDFEWKEIALPVEFTGSLTPSSEVRFFGISGGVGVLMWEAGSGDSLLVLGQKDGEKWSWRTRSGPALGGGKAPSNGQVEVGVAAGSVLVAARGESQDVDVVCTSIANDKAAWRTLATLRDIRGEYSLVPLDRDGRLCIAWAKPGAGANALSIAQLTELSAGTGRELFTGPIRTASPIGGADFILLGGMMVVVIGMVVTGLIRLPEGAVMIPEGTSIAEPSRRFFAGATDLLIGLVCVAFGTGSTMDQLMSLDWWVGSAGQITLMLTLVTLAVVGGVLESVFGRTPGKMLAGCEVVDVQVRLQKSDGERFTRPTLIRCLVRNFVKWCLPPVGFIGLMDPGGRYRADQFARSAVIAPIPPEEVDDDLDD